MKRKSRDQRRGPRILVQGGAEEVLRIMSGIMTLCTSSIDFKWRICIFVPSLIIVFVSKKRKVRERKDRAHLRAGRSGHVTAPLLCTSRCVLTHLLSSLASSKHLHYPKSYTLQIVQPIVLLWNQVVFEAKYRMIEAFCRRTESCSGNALNRAFGDVVFNSLSLSSK